MNSRSFYVGKAKISLTFEFIWNRVASPKKIKTPQDLKRIPVLHTYRNNLQFLFLKYLYFTELKTNLNLEYPGFLGLGLNSLLSGYILGKLSQNI